MLTSCLAACTHLSITVSEIQRDICEKIGILSSPLHSTPLLRGFPSEYRHSVWYGKTRMVSLPDGEKILKISLFVLAQLTNVTDAQTDRWTPGDSIYSAYAYASRGKNCARSILLLKRSHGPLATAELYLFSSPLRNRRFSDIC